ncbi:hypothetical protein LINGRAHAP2_LOCUS15022 [Linum grandiflorum]
MLECVSKVEVNRILALGRWSFDDIVIQLDIWIKEVGRSNVLLDSDVAWIIVCGIPLHLRSIDLFWQMGNICGGFLGSEVIGCFFFHSD